MKVLWLCNIVLPEFSGEFGLRKYHTGGWITSMLHQLERREGVDVAVCCPIIDEWRMKDGVCGGHQYYAFPFFNREYRECVKERFREILKDYAPDIVHIWGTEFPHTLAMVNACQEMGLLDKVAVNIQGLVSVYAQHYYADVPGRYITMSAEGYPTLKEEHDGFVFRGKYEAGALRKVRYVIGRTDWDEACAMRINPNVRYYFCNETLRDVFYEHAGEWSYDNCEKHSIFVSQAGYPVKGFHYLLKAMPEVLRHHPDAHIYVSGDNVMKPDQRGNVRPYGQYLGTLVQEYGLEGHITFLGMLSGQEMIAQYKRANVFVSASTVENESNSLSEAVLIGCPVVYSLVGGVVSREKAIGGFGYQHDAEYMLSYYINKVFGQQRFPCNYEAVRTFTDGETNTKTLCKIYQMIIEDHGK